MSASSPGKRLNVTNIYKETGISSTDHSVNGLSKEFLERARSRANQTCPDCKQGLLPIDEAIIMEEHKHKKGKGGFLHHAQKNLEDIFFCISCKKMNTRLSVHMKEVDMALKS